MKKIRTSFFTTALHILVYSAWVLLVVLSGCGRTITAGNTDAKLKVSITD